MNRQELAAYLEETYSTAGEQLFACCPGVQALLRQEKIPYSVLFFNCGMLQFCQKDKKKEEIL